MAEAQRTAAVEAAEMAALAAAEARTARETEEEARRADAAAAARAKSEAAAGQARREVEQTWQAREERHQQRAVMELTRRTEEKMATTRTAVGTGLTSALAHSLTRSRPVSAAYNNLRPLRSVTMKPVAASNATAAKAEEEAVVDAARTEAKWAERTVEVAQQVEEAQVAGALAKTRAKENSPQAEEVETGAEEVAIAGETTGAAATGEEVEEDSWYVRPHIPAKVIARRHIARYGQPSPYTIVDTKDPPGTTYVEHEALDGIVRRRKRRPPEKAKPGGEDLFVRDEGFGIAYIGHTAYVESARFAADAKARANGEPVEPPPEPEVRSVTDERRSAYRAEQRAEAEAAAASAYKLQRVLMR
jgi:hypothetical protein